MHVFVAQPKIRVRSNWRLPHCAQRMAPSSRSLQKVSAVCHEATAPQRAVFGGNPITEHTTASCLLCCLSPWPRVIHLCLQPLTFPTTIHADPLLGFSHTLIHPAWINYHRPNPPKTLSWITGKGAQSKRRWQKPQNSTRNNLRCKISNVEEFISLLNTPQVTLSCSVHLYFCQKGAVLAPCEYSRSVVANIELGLKSPNVWLSPVPYFPCPILLHSRGWSEPAPDPGHSGTPSHILCSHCSSLGLNRRPVCISIPAFNAWN